DGHGRPLRRAAVVRAHRRTTSAAPRSRPTRRRAGDLPVGALTGHFEVIDQARLPIYSWARELEPGALAQTVNCANLPPACHHVAVMADGHQGYGVPIGAVL